MILKAILLGIIEGLTEFLPVSSTGHLIIANKLISFEGSFAALFDITIQVGAILAVVVFYRKKLLPDRYFFSQLKAAYNGKPASSSLPEQDALSADYQAEVDGTQTAHNSAKKLLLFWCKIIAAFFPAAVVGLFLDDIIEKQLFNTASVSAALAAGAVMMIIAERKKNRLAVEQVETVTFKQAVIIGIFQCLAMWPGMSRSASTISGALFLGLSREAAAEFSFFLGIPTIMAASFYKLLKTNLAITTEQAISLAAGTVVSFFVALLVIKLFTAYLKKRGLLPFAVYRIALAAVIFFFVAGI